MKSRRIWIFAIAGLLVLAFRAVADEPLVKLKPDEQEVIEALVTQYLPKLNEPHILVDTAQPFFAPMLRSDASTRRNGWPNRPEITEALDDYLRKNTTPTHMIFPRAIAKGIETISEEDLSRLEGHSPKRHERDAFFKRFPKTDGPLSVSLPGFDANRSIAIIFLSDSMHGQFYYLEKHGHTWQLTDKPYGPSTDMDM